MTKTIERCKKARAAYLRYLASNYDTIFEAYGKPSQAKIEAWADCHEMCYKHRGQGLRVISKNCHIFTAGFTFKGNFGNTYFTYITPTYSATVLIE